MGENNYKVDKNLQTTAETPNWYKQWEQKCKTNTVSSYTTTFTTGKPIEFNAEDWHKEWTINSPVTIEEPKGWICPKCGRVNAPWVAACPCSQTQTKTVKSTWTTNIPSYCMGCSNHPINGGSGICHCILGSMQVTC